MVKTILSFTKSVIGTRQLKFIDNDAHESPNHFCMWVPNMWKKGLEEWICTINILIFWENLTCKTQATSVSPFGVQTIKFWRAHYHYTANIYHPAIVKLLRKSEKIIKKRYNLMIGRFVYKTYHWHPCIVKL